jgi:hypothetical protein
MGIFIVVAMVLFFLLRSDAPDIAADSDAGRVSAFVQGCADEVSLGVVHSIGIKGGYSDSPNGSISYGIPLYREQGIMATPSIENIEKEIAKEFNERLMSCVDNFSSFPDLNITQQQADSMAEVRDEEVVFSVKYPMVVEKGERRDSLEDFGEIYVSLPMGLMYKAASEIARTESVDNICMTCLAELAENNDFKIDILDYDENTVFFIISYYSELNEMVLEFTFGMRR